MPVFFFELPDGAVIRTTGGPPLTDFVEARSAAERMAKRLGEIEPEMTNRQLAVLVKTTDGMTVYSAEIGPVVGCAGE